ncbi:unnamed protein product, partial [Discosporangium mesarthrocarpum]
LKWLHRRYGEFAEENGYVRCEDPMTVSAIFRRLRDGGRYWTACGSYPVAWVRDLTEPGYDAETPDKRPQLPLLSAAGGGGGGGGEMLTFRLGGGAEGLVATLRTSGTEPKIKYYMELRGEPGV